MVGGIGVPVAIVAGVSDDILVTCVEIAGCKLESMVKVARAAADWDGSYGDGG